MKDLTLILECWDLYITITYYIVNNSEKII